MYQHSYSSSPVPVSGIHGHVLEVNVVGCNKLKDTEWISRQDPYVCLEYGSTKFRTRTSTDGGKNPTFQEKFVFTLIEGLQELNVVVWNSNTLTVDDFIGSGKLQLHKVLSTGYDDSPWPLQTKTGRHAGEVRLIMHYSNANKPAASCALSAPPYLTRAVPQVSMYSTPLPASAVPYPAPMGYPTPSTYSSYPTDVAAYPPQPYTPPQPHAYPLQSYALPSLYPPPPYTQPTHTAPHHPPGPFPGIYPRPTY